MAGNFYFSHPLTFILTHHPQAESARTLGRAKQQLTTLRADLQRAHKQEADVLKDANECQVDSKLRLMQYIRSLRRVMHLFMSIDAIYIDSRIYLHQLTHPVLLQVWFGKVIISSKNFNTDGTQWKFFKDTQCVEGGFRVSGVCVFACFQRGGAVFYTSASQTLPKSPYPEFSPTKCKTIALKWSRDVWQSERSKTTLCTPITSQIVQKFPKSQEQNKNIMAKTRAVLAWMCLEPPHVLQPCKTWITGGMAPAWEPAERFWRIIWHIWFFSGWKPLLLYQKNQQLQHSFQHISTILTCAKIRNLCNLEFPVPKIHRIADPPAKFPPNPIP